MKNHSFSLPLSVSAALILGLSVIHSAGPLSAQERRAEPKPRAEKSKPKGTSSSAARAANPAMPGSPKSRSAEIQMGNLEKMEAQKLQEELEAISMIVDNPLQKQTRPDMLLRRASLEYQLARLAFLVPGGGSAQKDSVFLKANRAVDDVFARHQLKQPRLSSKQLAQAYYLRGAIAQEVGDTSKLISNYEESLRLDPKSSQAPSLNLILGETFFDQEKYSEAISWYQRSLSSYNPQQLSIAHFKTGWSYLLQKNSDQASHHFLLVINQKSSTSLREDSVRALGFLVARDFSEEQVIALANERVQDPTLRRQFLQSAIQNIQAANKARIPYKVFNELYKNTQDPKEKLSVLAMLLGFERREIPTIGQRKAFEYLELLVVRNPRLAWTTWMKEMPQLEEDMRAYIQVLADHYQGKIPAQLEMERPQIVKLLDRQVDFYLTYLAKPITIKPLLNLWLDVATREQDHELAKRAVDRIALLKPEPAEELRRARLIYLGILDRRGADLPVFREMAVAEMKAFTATYPNDAESNRILLRLTQLLLAANQFAIAEPYLGELAQKQPSEPNQYNWIWTLFRLGRFADVVKASVGSNSSQRLRDVVRESHLKLAAVAQDEKKQKDFEGHAREYLKLAGSTPEARTVYANLLRSFLEQGDLDRYCEERAKLDPRARNEKVIADTETAAFDLMFEKGNLRDCSWSEARQKSETDLRVWLWRRSRGLGVGTQPVFERWSKDEQNLALGNLALVAPRELLRLLPEGAGKTNPEWGGLRILATQIAENRKISTTTAATLDASRIPRIVEQAAYPSSSTSAQRFNRILEDLVYRSGLVKRVWAKESKDLSQEMRLRVLLLAKDMESRIAKVVRSAPVPEGMNNAETTKFRASLETSAKDFDAQAAEYERAANVLREEIRIAEEKALEQRMPAIKAQDWFWASSEERERVLNLVRLHGAFFTLVHLEWNRSGKKINDTDYIRMRSGVLLSHNGSEVMRQVVRSELLALNAKDLVDKWRALP